MTRGGQSRQWRQFHAKRTLINLLHTRVAPPSPVPDTCCAPVCVYVCVRVCECECVGAIIICVLRAPLTVRTRSCCCCLISAPGQSAQHSQKTQHDSREKLHYNSIKNNSLWSNYIGREFNWIKFVRDKQKQNAVLCSLKFENIIRLIIDISWLHVV